MTRCPGSHDAGTRGGLTGRRHNLLVLHLHVIQSDIPAMCVCVCMCVYVCVCVYVYICVHVCACVCVSVYVSVYACMCVCGL